MTDDAAEPLARGRIVTVGGPVDELRVSLSLYGADLDPDEVSRVLGCTPTSSHRRGDVRVGKKTGRNTVRKEGAWFLSIEGRAPQTADELTAAILARVPLNDEIWSELAARFDIQMRYSVFLNAWNRGLDLEREVVQKVALIRAALVFDIYANLDGDSEEAEER